MKQNNKTEGHGKQIGYEDRIRGNQRIKGRISGAVHASYDAV